MNPTTRLELISDIALHLQSEFNANDINMLLGGYGIKTENVSIVSSKRIYVMDLLKTTIEEKLIQIAEDLELELPSGIKINKSRKSKKNQSRKIFISHSGKDSSIVEQVIEILEGIGTPADKIFCTSFEGYSIGLGQDFLETIKMELNNEVLVLFILSSNFYESPVSLCEMGATWVKTSEHIPILIPPFNFSEIKGVFPNTQGMKLNDKPKLNSLKEKIENFLSLKPKNFSAWERKRDNLVDTINVILDQNEENVTKKSSNNRNVTNNLSEQDKLIKQVSKKEWPNDYEMQVHFINKQRAAVDSLRKHNPIDISKEEFDIIRENAKNEWPQDFEMQLHYEQKQVENLRKLNEM